VRIFTQTLSSSQELGGIEHEIACDYYYLGDSIVGNSGPYYTGRYRPCGSQKWHSRNG
jgi:hypothetical protein